jgi:hypothetical protein
VIFHILRSAPSRHHEQAWLLLAEAVRNANDMVAMACELEAYGERESDDQ